MQFTHRTMQLQEDSGETGKKEICDSWDHLHAYHGGLFSDHIWEEVKSVAEEFGKDVSKLIDPVWI